MKEHTPVDDPASQKLFSVRVMPYMHSPSPINFSGILKEPKMTKKGLTA